MSIDTLADWLEQEGVVASEEPGAIADTARVGTLLIDAARRGEALSYAELLGLLGHRFTRPKMRALCRTLDAIDSARVAAGQLGLAVLVVREGDRLPGQGWWLDANARGYSGAITGTEACAHVNALQQAVFDYWRHR